LIAPDKQETIMSTLIKSINLQNRVKELLSDLGYTTAKQVAETLRISPDRIEHLLEMEPDGILALLPEPDKIAPRRRESSEFPLGAILENIPEQPLAFQITPRTATLPTSVNHISHLPAIRNQRGRGTCVAFATLAVLEHLKGGGTAGNTQDMSEQFQYYMCKQLDGIPNQSGTYLAVSFPSLVSNGCCHETTWPYVPNDIAGNEGQAPAPAIAISEARAHRPPSVKVLPATSVSHIKAELAAGRCVAFSIPVYNSWYENDGVTESGDIVMPLPGETRVGGHAMCLVGYQDSTAPGNPGGGRFLLRNSWGSDWGTNSPNGPGYGSIPYAYITQYGKEAHTIA
jgi:C1A family cysteine protease